jgi:hypothetical protein
MTQRVTEVSGLPVGLWSQTLSPEVGTIVWTAFVPDLPTLEAGLDKAAADAKYLELAEAGAEFIIPSSLDDSLGFVLHGEDADPDRVVNYVVVNRTTAATGGLAKAMAVGIEIAQKAEQISGNPVMFLADVSGNYGSVAWLSGAGDIGEMERALMAINADPSFVELIDTKAPDAYAGDPGASTQLIYRRLV